VINPYQRHVDGDGVLHGRSALIAIDETGIEIARYVDREFTRSAPDNKRIERVRSRMMGTEGVGLSVIGCLDPDDLRAGFTRIKPLAIGPVQITLIDEFAAHVHKMERP